MSIKDKKFKEQAIPYYEIYLEVSDMTVMVPVGKAEELGIRAIVPQVEAEAALSMISDAYEPKLRSSGRCTTGAR